MQLLTDFLQEHSTVLLPTTSEWLVISILDESAFAQMRHLYGLTDGNAKLSLICATAPQLRKYAARIHPRIDTLLSIHQKELALLHSSTEDMKQLVADLQIDDVESIYVRVTRDPELLACIVALDMPLLALDLGTDIDESWSSAVENFPQDRQPGSRARTVYAEYNEKAELHFHPTESD